LSSQFLVAPNLCKRPLSQERCPKRVFGGFMVTLVLEP
jgi:hypothetical protein